jgi:hypothetical protein
MNMTPMDRQAIRSVIEHQLLAFQQDDATTAFSYASEDIQAKFVSAPNFLDQVKQAYPAVYRPRAVLFDTLENDRTPMQEVLLLAPDGMLVRAMYLMYQQADRTWRIEGCLLESNESLDLAM